MKKLYVFFIFFYFTTSVFAISPHYKKPRNVVAIDNTTVLFLDFESINSTQAHDLSQSHNNGTISGATRTVDEYGQYLSFGIMGSSVDCGNDSSLDITTTLTMSAWITISTTYAEPNYGRILIKGNDDAAGYQMAIWKDGGSPIEILCNICSSGTDSNGIQAEVADAGLSLYIWAHIVGVYDSGWTIYVNGVSQTTTTGATLASYGSGSNLFIDNSAFAGNIDDVKIYSRALTAQEIIDLFESTRGRYGI